MAATKTHIKADPGWVIVDIQRKGTGDGTRWLIHETQVVAWYVATESKTANYIDDDVSHHQLVAIGVGRNSLQAWGVKSPTGVYTQEGNFSGGYGDLFLYLSRFYSEVPDGEFVR